MCGITGFIEKTEKKIAESNLRLMVKQIRHRGPDSNGIWYDENNGIGLAHARLSILDLTSAGHQPMASYSERYIISFNCPSSSTYECNKSKKVIIIYRYMFAGQ